MGAGASCCCSDTAAQPGLPLSASASNPSSSSSSAVSLSAASGSVVDDVSLFLSPPPLSMRSFVSDTCLRRMEAVHAARGSPIPGSEAAATATREELRGAVVFCEILHFHRLVGQAQHVDAALAAVHALVVRFVYHCGGDVLKMVGGGVLALFAGDAETEQTLAIRAIACSRKLVRLVQEYNTAAFTDLQLHAGVGVGTALSVHVGGAADRWQHLVVGPLIAQMRCAAFGGAGETCISRQTWHVVRDVVTCHPSGDDAFVVDTLRIGQDNAAVRKVHEARLSDLTPRSLHLTPAQQACVARYVPRHLMARLRSGARVEVGDYEFRRATVLFLRIGVAARMCDDATVRQLDDVVNMVHTLVQHFEGTLLHFIVDDRATRAVIGFGLLTERDDDATRAVRAALHIHKHAAASLGDDTVPSIAIAIATGRVSYALAGCSARASPILNGSRVNVCTQLVCHARGRILCDANTHAACQDSTAFQEAKRVHIKGMAAPLQVYCPVASPSCTSQEPPATTTPFECGGDAHMGSPPAAAAAHAAACRSFPRTNRPVGAGADECKAVRGPGDAHAARHAITGTTTCSTGVAAAVPQPISFRQEPVHASPSHTERRDDT